MEQRISKAELARQWAKRCKEAEEYLESQPLDYQPLVTDCYVDSENVVQAKEMFDQRKEEYMKKRNELIGEAVSKIRALIRENSMTVMSSFAKEQPNRYHNPGQGPKYSDSLREKKAGKGRLFNIEELKEKGKDFAWELKTGTKEEMEHTKDPKKARKIAMDHLKEDPHYYKKLKKVGLVKDQVQPKPEPKEPDTITEPEPDTTTEPEPKRWSPFSPDVDPEAIPAPKARKK